MITLSMADTCCPAPLYLGLDFGTSGARVAVVAADGLVVFQAGCDYGDGSQAVVQPREPRDRPYRPQVWQRVLWQLLSAVPVEYRQRLAAIALDGTSSTVLLCDPSGQPLLEPLMYNDDRGQVLLETIAAIAPPQHTVLSATSSLAKLLWWQSHYTDQLADPVPAQLYLLHQADWLGWLLHGQLGVTDYHNALKLGYDVQQLVYPNWLITGIKSAHHPEASGNSVWDRLRLPQVVAPGTPVGTVQAEIAAQFQLPATCQICAGTTDSIAAFLASGASTPGTAVTSLGSTLVIKLLSHTPVTDSRSGVYSHRWGDRWLVGGASNTGGAVLRQFFTDQQLVQLSDRIDPTVPSPLDYYPLPKPGERFPINDPQLLPRLSPRPDDPVTFLHGLLQSMARIEALAYRQLTALGATAVTQVYTAGGGAGNPVWTRIRAMELGVPVTASLHTDAAVGAALLAQQPLTKQPLTKP